MIQEKDTFQFYARTTFSVAAWVGLAFLTFRVVFWDSSRESIFWAVVTYLCLTTSILVLAISGGVSHFFSALLAILLAGALMLGAMCLAVTALPYVGFSGTLFGG
jgi:hypothetical protein